MHSLITAFVVVILEVLFAVLVWVAAESTVAKRCEKIGMFVFDEQVYECKQKATFK